MQIQMFHRNLLPASSGQRRLLNLEMEVAESFKIVIPINQNTRYHMLEDHNLKSPV